MWREAARQYVAVGKVKRYAKLMRDDRPVDLFHVHSSPVDLPAGLPVVSRPECDEEALHASTHCILNQPFVDMVATGVEFAWLSCYAATWFCWRLLEELDQLQVSETFPHSAWGADSTVVALLWLQDQAMERTYNCGKRHAAPTIGSSLHSDSDTDNPHGKYS